MKEDRSLFRKCLDVVMKNEGWLVTTNDKVDHGGLTYCGITQKVYDEWCKENEMPEGIVYEMAGDVLEDIYHSYWTTCHCQLILDDQLAFYLFDCAVNMGSYRACRLMQRSMVSMGVSITVDGTIGSQTLKIVSTLDPTILLQHFRIHRQKFYHNIVANDRSQGKFLNGWLKRCEVTI